MHLIQTIALGIFILGSSIVSPTASSALEQVRCDRFDLRATLRGDQIDVLLDTDCPDFADVMLSVSRTYHRVGSEDAYVLHYFNDKSTIADLRRSKTISVTDARWKGALEERRRESSRMGDSFAIARVDINIEVSATVPAYQTDQRFAPNNENLVGDAVSRVGALRVVEDEVLIPHPLDNASAEAGSVPLPSTDPYSLDTNQAYRLSRATPLMPSSNPRDPLGALGEARQIPAGYVIRVIDVSDVGGTPWYQVIVSSEAGSQTASGWINAIALLGQELEAVDP